MNFKNIYKNLMINKINKSIFIVEILNFTAVF